mgnify:FL=1
MKAIRFVFCLFAALMLTTLNGLAAEEEDFKTFLQKFTSSASFQYSRIKFPLKSPIALLKDDGETEQTFPFTREKWALLDEETLKEGRTTEEEGGTYISHFTVNEPAHKEFEAGYDESEPSLRVVFELTDGKWYVTDCYNDWYNFDLPINELEETIQAVQEENKAFEELRTRVFNLEYSKYLDEIASKRKTMVSTGDRSAKIRTYNYPQGRITDHRINYTIYNLAAFMDGDIQDCIDHLIVAENAERLKESEL